MRSQSQSASALQVGQVFIPRRVLNSGVFVPDGLLACHLVSKRCQALVGAAGPLCRDQRPVFPSAGHDDSRSRAFAAAGTFWSLWGRGLGPSLRVLFRSINIAGLADCAFSAECGWPSALPGAASGKLFQALDGGGKSVPLDLQVRDDPVEVHLMPPSGAGQRIHAATVNLGESGSSDGSTARLSS